MGLLLNQLTRVIVGEAGAQYCMFPQLGSKTLYPANYISIKLLSGRSAPSSKMARTRQRNLYYRFALKEKKPSAVLRVWF